MPTCPVMADLNAYHAETDKREAAADQAEQEARKELKYFNIVDLIDAVAHKYVRPDNPHSEVFVNLMAETLHEIESGNEFLSVRSDLEEIFIDMEREES